MIPRGGSRPPLSATGIAAPTTSDVSRIPFCLIFRAEFTSVLITSPHWWHVYNPRCTRFAGICFLDVVIFKELGAEIIEKIIGSRFFRSYFHVNVCRYPKTITIAQVVVYDVAQLLLLILIEIHQQAFIDDGDRAGGEHVNRLGKFCALLDPLSAAVCSPEEIRQMVDEMFDAERKWLGWFES